MCVAVRRRSVNRRQYLATATLSTAALAGCTGLLNDPEPSRLDLTVQNETDSRVTVEVTVTGPDGETYLNESDGVDPDVARAFEATVATDGRHEVVVSGSDFEGSLAWDAGVCLLYDGRVLLTAESVETEGECVDER